VQRVYSGLGQRDSLENRDIAILPAQLEHVGELLGGALRKRQVGLVDHQHIGDFEDAGLHRLHLVAHVGRIHHHAYIGDLDDLDFRLAGADGLDDDEIAAGRVHGIDDAVDAFRQAAEMTVRCHRADEHAGILGVTPHPHAVAENGPAGDRA
jgi:hypothetical protein